MTELTVRTGHRREQLLALLADGQWHSGEQLAERLMITRAAVWKLIHGLTDLGVLIEAHHQGYRLAHAIDLYDAAQLSVFCGERAGDLQHIHTLFEVDSTNTYVSRCPVVESGKAVLCVAELQQSGRGRRGRSWYAPFGESICMSLGYMFDYLPPHFSSLSLVVGIALTRVLRDLGAREVGVKWPNDLLWQGRKLAGVLIEMRGEPDGQAQMVIGIGLNHWLSDVTRAHMVAQQLVVCDLHEILGERCPSRNRLVALFTVELMQCLKLFTQSGFSSFMDEWRAYDVLNQQAVQILQGERSIAGIAQGITVDGLLLLNTSEGLQQFNSGEVSLRARPS